MTTETQAPPANHDDWVTVEDRRRWWTTPRRVPWGANVARKLSGDKYGQTGAGIGREMGPDQTKGGIHTAEGDTIAEAFEAAGLLWEPEALPLHAVVAPTYFAYPNEGRPTLAETTDSAACPVVEVPGKQLIVRDDTRAPLGVVGSKFEPIPNSRLEAFATALVDQTLSDKIAAGVTGVGERTFVAVKLTDDMVVGGIPSEVTESWLVAANFHNGNGSFRATVFPLRKVCSNTLHVTMREHVRSWTIRHTKSADWRVGEAQRALGLAGAYLEEWREGMEALLDVELTKRQVTHRLRTLFPNPKKPDEFTDDKAERRYARQLEEARTIRAEIEELHAEAENLNAVRGTAYGVLQAVNEWELWRKPVRGVADEIRADWQMGKLLKDWEPELTRRAMKLLVGGGVER